MVIEGQVDPPVEGVHLTATSKEYNATGVSDKNGKYRIGPMPSMPVSIHYNSNDDDQYVVSAELEDYEIKLISPHWIQARKLPFIKTFIKDLHTGRSLTTASLSLKWTDP